VQVEDVEHRLIGIASLLILSKSLEKSTNTIAAVLLPIWHSSTSIMIERIWGSVDLPLRNPFWL
jgi:hypothetical protein